MIINIPDQFGSDSAKKAFSLALAVYAHTEGDRYENENNFQRLSQDKSIIQSAKTFEEYLKS